MTRRVLTPRSPSQHQFLAGECRSVIDQHRQHGQVARRGSSHGRGFSERGFRWCGESGALLLPGARRRVGAACSSSGSGCKGEGRGSCVRGSLRFPGGPSRASQRPNRTQMKVSRRIPIKTIVRQDQARRAVSQYDNRCVLQTAGGRPPITRTGPGPRSSTCRRSRGGPKDSFSPTSRGHPTPLTTKLAASYVVENRARLCVPEISGRPVSPWPGTTCSAPFFFQARQTDRWSLDALWAGPPKNKVITAQGGHDDFISRWPDWPTVSRETISQAWTARTLPGPRRQVEGKEGAQAFFTSSTSQNSDT